MGDEASAELILPASLSAMTCKQLFDFQQTALNLEAQQDYAQLVVDLAKVLNVKESVLAELPINEGEGITLLGIFSHLSDVVSNLEVEDEPPKFEHGGELYFSRIREIDIVLGIEKALSTIEMVSLQEIERDLRQVQESRKPKPSEEEKEPVADELDDDGYLKTREAFLDPDLDFQFSAYTMAILLRKEGELLPMSVEERKKFVVRRSKFFEKAHASLAISLRNFFVYRWLKYLKTAVSGQR